MTTPWHNAPWTPRAWQAEALPEIVDAMRRGERGLVSAIMGSGKSVLMAELVWLAMHKRGDRAIVVTAPRQFLVRQLAATIADRVGSLEVGLYYAEKKQPRRSVIVTCAASLSSLRVELESQGRRVALLIADEAHGTEAVMAKTEIPALAPVCLVGFTATPYRSTPSESVSLFSTVIYRYTMKDALRDRVLVPMRHVRYEGNDPGTVDEECLRLIRQYGNGPGIVSASSILDADEYAHWLTERWEPTSAIHSRIKTNTRAAMLCGLQSGAKSALVHVSLLAEGVDLPWLRWLCLRRRVGARVRFLQEVGRVLRTHPGKEEGIVMDPHLLLGRHGLTTAEAIGLAMEEAAEAEARDPSAKEAAEPTEAEVVALDRLLEYLGDVRMLLEHGEIIKPRTIEGGGWQIAMVSEKQVKAIKGASRLTRHVPGDYREPIKALVKVPWALNRGQAADLLDVLYGGSRWARERAETSGRKAYLLQWSQRHMGGVVPPSDAEANIVRRMKC